MLAVISDAPPGDGAAPAPEQEQKPEATAEAEAEPETEPEPKPEPAAEPVAETPKKEDVPKKAWTFDIPKTYDDGVDAPKKQTVPPYLDEGVKPYRQKYLVIMRRWQ